MRPTPKPGVGESTALSATVRIETHEAISVIAFASRGLTFDDVVEQALSQYAKRNVRTIEKNRARYVQTRFDRKPQRG